MHPPSVSADRHIDTQYLYLRTNRLLRYRISCEQAAPSAPHTFGLELFQTPLRLQRPRYDCFFGASTELSLQLCRGIRFFPPLSSQHLREPCSTVTDIFKPSTANSKILFRDPFRATLKPTSGTVRACPTSRIRNRTLVSRPFFFDSDVLPDHHPPKSICLYYYHTLKSVPQTIFY